MNILQRLHDDHEAVKDLLSKMAECEDADECKRLIDKVSEELLPHSTAEESALYRRLKALDDGEDIALEGDEEHKVAERVVESLKKSPKKGSGRWRARATVLKELVEHHIEEEEDEAFQIARENFSEAELEAMGSEFETKKGRQQ